jgi:hypothetical protein
MVEAMNFIDEQDIAFLQIGKNRRQITGTLDNRP